MQNFQFLFPIFFILLFSCSPTKKLKKSISTQIEHSLVFNNSLSGVALYDLEKQEFIHQKNADKYFTPASNTKILTFFTALHILENTVPALRYEIHGDSLIFWGTGDPSFLNQYLRENDIAFKFLKNRKEKLYFCPTNFQDGRFGEGWMWDDFPYSFQPEKSAFPIYSNLITFVGDTIDGGFETHPKFFERNLAFDENLENKYPRIRRNEFGNNFKYNEKAANANTYFKRERPYRANSEFITELLSDTLKKKVNLLNTNLLPNEKSIKLLGHSSLPLYQELMINSDNHIAEQLLLMCSEKVFGTMNTTQIIQYAKDSLMQGIPDEPLWVDGSGVSRYNLFTPRSLVWLLEKMYQQKGQEKIFDIFPAGGVSGTTQKWYGMEGEPPFVFAKTGTLRNNHCLSGYILTKSGKVLIFSFMHNHFKGSSARFKKEMEMILRKIYDQI